MKKRKGTSRAKRGRRKEIKSRREKLLQSLCHDPQHRQRARKTKKEPMSRSWNRTDIRRPIKIAKLNNNKPKLVVHLVRIARFSKMEEEIARLQQEATAWRAMQIPQMGYYNRCKCSRGLPCRLINKLRSQSSQLVKINLVTHSFRWRMVGAVDRQVLPTPHSKLKAPIANNNSSLKVV